jgi:hypothetical protein
MKRDGPRPWEGPWYHAASGSKQHLSKATDERRALCGVDLVGGSNSAWPGDRWVCRTCRKIDGRRR